MNAVSGYGDSLSIGIEENWDSTRFDELFLEATYKIEDIFDDSVDSLREFERLVGELKQIKNDHIGTLFLDSLLFVAKVASDQNADPEQVVNELIHRVSKMIEMDPQYDGVVLFPGFLYLMRASLFLENGELTQALEDASKAIAIGPEARAALSAKLSEDLDTALNWELVSETKTGVGSNEFQYRHKGGIPKNPSNVFFKESLQSYIEESLISENRREMTYDQVLQALSQFLSVREFGPEDGARETAIIKAALELSVELDPENEEAVELLKRFFPSEDLRAFPKA